VVPVLCVVGFATLLVGAISRHSAAMRFGAAIFLLGVAVWALANGFQFVRAFILGARLHGWRASFQNPWSAIIFILLMIFFLWFGTRVVLFIMRSLHATTSNQSLQLTAGRSDASHEIMKTLPLQSALAPASGS
jgi:thiol:disulfide interchange protein